MTVKEFEKGFQEVWAQFKETDKKIDKVRVQVGHEMAQVGREVAQVSQEVAQLSRVVTRVTQNVDKLTGKWGRFVEGLVAPAIERLFQERNIKVDKVYQRVRAHKNGRAMEIDLLVTNEEYAVLVEAKSTLGVDDVKEHLHRLNDFKSLFPEYGDKKIFGAVAGIVIEQGADRFAYRKGLFVLGQSGETVKILNDEQFEPKIW